MKQLRIEEITPFPFESLRKLAFLSSMPSRGRHQSTSKECERIIRRIEALDGVIGVIIGRSYGGKSLGRHHSTGSVKVQRMEDAGFKAVTQTEKGLQELFVRTDPSKIKTIAEAVRSIS